MERETEKEKDKDKERKKEKEEEIRRWLAENVTADTMVGIFNAWCGLAGVAGTVLACVVFRNGFVVSMLCGAVLSACVCKLCKFFFWVLRGFDARLCTLVTRPVPPESVQKRRKKRWYPSEPGYPSGHANSLFFLASYSATMSWLAHHAGVWWGSSPHGGAVAFMVAVACYLGAAVIAYSRVAVTRDHTFEQVLAGVLTGTSMGCLWALGSVRLVVVPCR